MSSIDPDIKITYRLESDSPSTIRTARLTGEAYACGYGIPRDAIVLSATPV